MITKVLFKVFPLLSFMLGGLWFNSYAQTIVVDSSILDRLNALEEQVNYHKPGEDHFMVAGLTTFGFVSTQSKNTIGGVTTSVKSNSMADADHYEFSPMLLWRHGKKVLLEFEPSFSNNSLGVNWADVSYFLAPNLIVRGGYLVLPFGTYAKREAAGWISKVASDPIGISALPAADYGVEIEGGLPLGSMKMNYDVAVTNGYQLLTDSSNTANIGTLVGGNITDNNNNKTITARLGLLPFSNSCLELGVSGMFGKLGDISTDYENVKGTMYALDLNYVKSFNPVLVNVKAQYNDVNIGDAIYNNTPSDPTKGYTFNNHTTSYFAQGSIRPTGLQNFLKNFELAGRYTFYTLPANPNYGSDTHTVSLALDYWLSWRTVVKLAYENYTSNSTATLDANNTGKTTNNSLILQFSIQL